MPIPPLRGVLAAMLTPRRADGDTDLAALRRNIEFVLEHGITGVAIGGATGEYPGLSSEERRRLLESALEVTRGRAWLVCGAGAVRLEETLEVSGHAARVGADLVLLPPPHFFPYGEDDLEAFYRAAAERIRLPVLVYHLPAFTSGVAPALVLRLVAGCPTIAGVKDSSGSLETLAALTRRFPGRALRIVGNDAALEAALAAGCCDAVISGVAGVLPELVQAVWNNPGGRAGHRLAEFIDRIDAFPISWGLKLAAELRGLFPATLSLPVSQARARQMAEFRRWFEAWWERTAAEVAPLAGQRKA